MRQNEFEDKKGQTEIVRTEDRQDNSQQNEKKDTHVTVLTP